MAPVVPPLRFDVCADLLGDPVDWHDGDRIRAGDVWRDAHLWLRQWQLWRAVLSLLRLRPHRRQVRTALAGKHVAQSVSSASRLSPSVTPVMEYWAAHATDAGTGRGQSTLGGEGVACGAVLHVGGALHVGGSVTCWSAKLRKCPALGGQARYCLMWHCLMRYRLMRYCLIWHCLIWHSLIWHCLMWYCLAGSVPQVTESLWRVSQFLGAGASCLARPLLSPAPSPSRSAPGGWP